MANTYRQPQRNTESSAAPCHICLHKNYVWRHKHWSLYDGELAKHLQDNGFSEERITPILQWVHSIRANYGGMVDERGSYLSAWEARREVQNQYEKTYARPDEPRSVNGRQITFRAFLHLLTATKSKHAAVWLEYLTGQFTEADMADEGKWSDFVKFMFEYERSSQDPDNAEFLQRVDVRPVVQMAGAGR